MMAVGMSKARGLLRALAALVVVVAAACGGPDRPEPATGGAGATGTAAADGAGGGVSPNEPIRIALLVPRTNQIEGVAQLGEAISNAAQLGLAELRDPQISLSIYDTGGLPARAGQVARQAVSEGADVVLGPLFAASTDEVAAVAGPAGLKVLSFSTITTVAGGPVSLIGYTPEAEARRILGYAASQGRRQIALFYPRNDYGEAALRGAQSVAGPGAVRLSAIAAYERSFKDIEASSGPFARDARGTGTDAVFLPAAGRELQAVASFMNFHGLDPREVRYLGLGQWNSRATFGEAALEGGWFPGPDPQAFERFSARYRARFGAEPPLLGSLGLTGMQVIGQLAASARAERRPDVFAASAITRPQGFRGALGPLRILPDGTAEHALAILEVGAGRFIVRDPAPRAIGAGS